MFRSQMGSCGDLEKLIKANKLEEKYKTRRKSE